MHIFKLVLTVLILFTSLNSSAFCHEVKNLNNEVCIQSISKESNITTRKNNEGIVLNQQRNTQNLNISRRNINDSSNTNDTNFILFNKQYNNLIKYIHSQLYLDNKKELALLTLLHQIQPNAP